MTSTSFETLHEEWLLRHQQVQELLQQHQNTTTNDDDDDDSDHHTAAAHLWTQSLITRAGRLGALQCAALQQEANDEDGSAIRALLQATKAELDQEATDITSDLLEQVVIAPVQNSLATNNPDAIMMIRKQLQQQQVASVDVDAFFEAYPECMRSDWKEIQKKSSSITDDGDSSSEEETETMMMVPSVKKVATNSRGTMTTAPYPEQPSKPAAAVPPPRSSSNNPYQQSRPQMSGGFSYTPPDPSSSYQQQQPPPLPQVQIQAMNKYSNNGGRPNNPYAARHQQSQQAVSSSSWDDHVQQQNPFQTAREFAKAGGGAQAPPPPPPPPPQRGNGGGGYSANPYMANHNPNAFHHHHHHHQQQQQYQQDQEEATMMPGGPHIPESLKRKFQPPTKRANNNSENNGGDAKQPASNHNRKPGAAVTAASTKGGITARKQPATTTNNNNNTNSSEDDEDALPEELQHLDKELVEKIQNEIMETGDRITFDDIAGLQDAKQTVQEVVCWPMKRPDLFTGLRRAPNGLLLYGPPGTGKTLIGKAIAHESGATFFSISSSSLTSKWIGEGEKLVKTLFAVAAYREPAVVFIDEIDSLLTQRKSSENEASRRIKTEFLVQLDGTGTSGQGRVLVIGATNRPQELDEAARRRFTKRLYIPLPDMSDRNVLLNVMLKKNNHQLTSADIERLAKETDGFSGADLKALCTDAAMGPIRQLGPKALDVDVNDIPPISFKHFKRSLKGMKPSVAASDLIQYEEWDKTYGSKLAEEDESSDDSDNE